MADHRQTSKPTVTLPTQNSSETVISMILGLLVIAIVGSFAFSFYRSWSNRQANAPEDGPETSPAPVMVEELPTSVETELDEATGREVPANLPAQYSVKPGDSTWKIAEAFYGSGFNYIDIENANQLERDSELTVGMELTIPRTPIRTAQEAGQPFEYEQHEGSDRVVTPGPQKGESANAASESADNDSMPESEVESAEPNSNSQL